jgi:hypothetical protein
MTSLGGRNSGLRALPNIRLKLTAAVVCGRIAFLNVLDRRRSLSAQSLDRERSTAFWLRQFSSQRETHGHTDGSDHSPHWFPGA